MTQNTEFGQVIARRVGDRVEVVQADDVVEVAGELAEQLGVKAPLGGRVTLAPGYDYDLDTWDGTGSLPGRHPGTFVGRRVRPEVQR